MSLIQKMEMERRLPETFFYSYFKHKQSLVIDNSIYNIVNYPPRNNERIRLAGKDYHLKKSVNIELIENAYIERYGNVKYNNDLDDFIKLVKLEICKDKFGLVKKCLLVESLPQKNVLLFNRHLFPLEHANNGEVKVCNKIFKINKRCCSLEDIERRYKQSLEQALNNFQTDYYNEIKNIGYKILGNRFYIYTKIKPYVLFERRNKKYYRFPEAIVGSYLYKTKDGKMKFNQLKVLNKYSHPALPLFDQTMQKICVGDYDYTCLQEEFNEHKLEVIEELMNKARKVLTKEYRSNGQPYHFLTEPYFQRFQTENFEKSEVVNI